MIVTQKEDMTPKGHTALRQCESKCYLFDDNKRFMRTYFIVEFGFAQS